MRIRSACAVICVVLGFHAVGLWKLYDLWHWYDMPMHFFGGVAMGVLAWAVWDRYIRDIKFAVRHPAAKRIAFMLWLVGFTAVIGIAWEWFEFALDMFVFPTLNAQPSIADTMADLFFDLTGAATVSLLRMRV